MVTVKSKNTKEKSSTKASKKSSDSSTVQRGKHTSAGKPRLLAQYETKVLPELKKLYPSKNVMQMPKLIKIVVNTCQSEATQNIKALEAAVAELELITGQKPIITRAKKSIAAFKLRAGMPIGASVTLRKERMYEFYDRLTTVSLPRTRDFRGVSSSSFDGRGNYSLGIKEQIIFPEIEADKVDKTRGLSVTIVTSACDNKSAHDLLTLMGMPFRKQ